MPKNFDKYYYAQVPIEHSDWAYLKKYAEECGCTKADIIRDLVHGLREYEGVGTVSTRCNCSH